MLWLLIKGCLIGFTIAAPVGPIGLLVIRRTLAHGHANGLATGAGTAMGDAFYGAVAALGFTAVSDALLDFRGWIALVGGAMLVWLGVSIARSRPADMAADGSSPTRLIAAFTSSFVLTLTSPVTILIFVGLFASLGPVAGAGVGGAMLVVLGVFIGSATWWVILTSVTARLRRAITTAHLRWINLGSGLMIAGFGATAIARELMRQG